VNLGQRITSFGLSWGPTLIVLGWVVAQIPSVAEGGPISSAPFAGVLFGLAALLGGAVLATSREIADSLCGLGLVVVGAWLALSCLT